jgi:hypothetical protein
LVDVHLRAVLVEELDESTTCGLVNTIKMQNEEI